MSAEKAATAAAPAPALVSAPAESQPPRALDSEVPLETGSTASKSSQAPEASRDGVEAQYVTGYKLAAVVFCVALACFLMLVDTMVVSTAIPRITDDFQSLADVGWYASAYQFGSAAPQPLSGKVYTHFNNKASFLFFFFIFEVGSVLCGAAVGSNMLIVGRVVAGLGAAGIINGGLTIISSCAPMEKRPALIGLTMGLNQLGLVAGPLIGGAFTSYSTWRWCFYINLPIGALVVGVLLLLRIPEQTVKKPALQVLPQLHKLLDLVGFCLFAPAVLQLLLALQFGGTRFAWHSSQVIGLFCGSAATFVVWLFWNHRQGANALLPHSMISLTPVWSSSLYQAFLMSALYGATFYLPIYFQAIHDVSAMLSGVYLLPTILPQLFMAGSSGVVISKIGYVIPSALFCTVLLSTASGLYSTLDVDSGRGKWFGFQVLAGIGSGAGLQAAIIAVQAAVDGEQLSSAMAFVIFGQSLGPAIALALCQLIFYQSLRSQITKHSPDTDPAVIINAGATGFRDELDSEELAVILVAYAESISRVFYLVASVAAASVLTIWGMGWKNLRPPPGPPPGKDDHSASLASKTKDKPQE